MLDKALIQKLRESKSIVVFTGAGISAESGVPTFRDAQTGLWANFKAEELATRAAFRKNPKMVWEWYAMRRAMILDVKPNAGHYAIAEMEKRRDVLLVTQNVDSLHSVAGSKSVLELHGNIFRTKCFMNNEIIDSWSDEEIPPRCPNCGSHLRPDVVWFGEDLSDGAISKTEEAIDRCDIFITIGTSGLVYPAAELPFYARKAGAFTIEINTEPTPFSDYASCSLRGKSGEILPQFLSAM